MMTRLYLLILSCSVTFAVRAATPTIPNTCKNNYPQLNVSLLEASTAANLEQVNATIACGANVNFADSNGCTPLLAATDEPSRACRASVKWIDSFFYLRSLEIAKLLIDKGAYFDVTEVITGETALHKAVRTSSVPLVEMLIANDVDLNIQDKNGMTPLVLGVQIGSSWTVEKLIDAGADLMIRDNEGKTAYDRGEWLYPEGLREKLLPVSKEFEVKGAKNGNCSPLEVHISANERVRVILSAEGSMFMLSSPKAGINLMANANGRAEKVVTLKAGEYVFQCGVHGGKQSNGKFIVH